MMIVLFVIDPLPGLKAYKDSSVAMMRALVARGHRLSVVLQGGLFIQAGQVFAHATPISLVPDADLHGHASARLDHRKELRRASEQTRTRPESEG
jgi:glutathione synthase